jgi:hypothetical protein
LNAIGHITLSSHILHVLFHVALKNCYCTCYPNIFAQSEDESGIRARAVYYTNIDKKNHPGDVRLFFESFGREVHSLYTFAERLNYISTKMAYDMFVKILHRTSSFESML